MSGDYLLRDAFNAEWVRQQMPARRGKGVLAKLQDMIYQEAEQGFYEVVVREPLTAEEIRGYCFGDPCEVMQEVSGFLVANGFAIEGVSSGADEGNAILISWAVPKEPAS